MTKFQEAGFFATFEQAYVGSTIKFSCSSHVTSCQLVSATVLSAVLKAIVSGPQVAVAATVISTSFPPQ